MKTKPTADYADFADEETPLFKSAKSAMLSSNFSVFLVSYDSAKGRSRFAEHRN
jgi:hypothetical protein